MNSEENTSAHTEYWERKRKSRRRVEWNSTDQIDTNETCINELQLKVENKEYIALLILVLFIYLFIVRKLFLHIFYPNNSWLVCVFAFACECSRNLRLLIWSISCYCFKFFWKYKLVYVLVCKPSVYLLVFFFSFSSC